MDGIAEEIPPVHVVNVNSIGVEPRHRPRVNHSEPKSAVLKTSRSAGEIRTAHVERVAAAKTGAKAIVGNAPMARLCLYSVGRLRRLGSSLLLRVLLGLRRSSLLLRVLLCLRRSSLLLRVLRLRLRRFSLLLRVLLCLRRFSLLLRVLLCLRRFRLLLCALRLRRSSLLLRVWLRRSGLWLRVLLRLRRSSLLRLLLLRLPLLASLRISGSNSYGEQEQTCDS
jgi:hypothetical protein